MGICGDWFGMKYSRWVHLVLLIELLVLYALVICLVFLRDGELQVRVYWFVAFGAVVFLGLWILRGLRSLDGCFPAFHYSTLLLELVIHLVSLVMGIMSVSKSPAIQPNELGIGIFVLRILLNLTYLWLVYKLFGVVWGLTVGSPSEKEKLDAEVQGLGGKDAEQEPLTGTQ